MPAFVDTGLNLVACRRRRRRPSCRARARPDRRALHSRRRERARSRDMLADIAAPRRAASRRRSSCRGRRSIRSPTERRCWRASRGTRAVRDDRRPADGAPPHVLRRSARRGASSAMRRGPIARALPMRSPGFARTAISNDRSSPSPSFRSRSGPIFCSAGDGSGCAASATTRRRTSATEPARLAERRRGHPGARRGRRDRAQRRLACCARTIPGAFRVVAGRRPEHRRHGRRRVGRGERRRSADRLEIVTGAGPPPGWTGKLWAMRQGWPRSRRRGRA